MVQKRLLLYTEMPVLAIGVTAALTEVGWDVQSSTSIADLQVLITANKPDVLVLDHSPQMSYDGIVQFVKSFPGESIVVLEHDMSIELSLQVFHTGVKGIIAKTLPVPELIERLTTVANGERCFEKALTDELLFGQRVHLTKRESEVVTLVAQGLANKEIAFQLELTEGTVKVYLSRLFDKTGVDNRLELALYGLKNFGQLSNLQATKTSMIMRKERIAA